MKTSKHEPITVYGKLAKITLADTKDISNTKPAPVAKPNAKRRRRSNSQPTK